MAGAGGYIYEECHTVQFVHHKPILLLSQAAAALHFPQVSRPVQYEWNDSETETQTAIVSYRH